MSEPIIVDEYSHIVVRILDGDMSARIQLFQGLPGTDTPHGTPLVDFVLTLPGCQKLVDGLN